MLRVAICDDEVLFQQRLAGKIRIFSQKFGDEIEFQFFSTAEAILNAPFHYDILFLDISLNNGEDGIEVGRQLREMGSHAVFILVTSHENRVRDGYFTEALRFITKPVEQAVLEEALAAAKHHLHMDVMMLEVRFDGVSSYVAVQDIIVVESYHRKRYVYVKNNKLETNEQWASLIARLPQKQFFMLQKSYVINLAHVASVSKALVTMSDGTTYNILRGRYGDFNRAFLAYLGGLR